MCCVVCCVLCAVCCLVLCCVEGYLWPCQWLCCAVLCFVLYIMCCVVSSVALCGRLSLAVSGALGSKKLPLPPFHATLHTVSVEVHPLCQFEEIRGVKPPSVAGGQEHWDGKCVAS